MLLEATLHDITAVQQNATFQRSSAVVRAHHAEDPATYVPQEHNDISAAVSDAVSNFTPPSDEDEAAHVAGTHMALLDMLRDTLATLVRQRDDLDAHDITGIERLNEQILGTIGDIDQAVRDPITAVQCRTIRFHLATP